MPVILALWCFADWWFGYLWRVDKEKSKRKQKWKLNIDIFTQLFRFGLLMSKLFRFGLYRVQSFAERVAYLRHPINLRLFNWRVPALIDI